MPLGRGPVPGTSRTALCGTKTQSDRALWYKTVSFFAVHFPGGEEGGHGPSLLLSQMWKRFSTGGCTVQSVLVVVQCVLVQRTTAFFAGSSSVVLLQRLISKIVLQVVVLTAGISTLETPHHAARHYAHRVARWLPVVFTFAGSTSSSLLLVQTPALYNCTRGTTAPAPSLQ
eukprot:759037-Rhodomonas_salina.1